MTTLADRIVTRIEHWSGQRIFLVTFFVAQSGTVLVVSGMSLLFHGTIRADFIVSGAVAALVVSLMVGNVLSGLIEQIRTLASHDALTGLPNRAMSSQRVQQGLAMAERNKSRLALMLVDLDNFKQINDLQGHVGGDQILLSVGKRITGCLRKSDLVGRLDGDEFVVVLPDVKHQESVTRVADKIRTALREPMLASGQILSVSASIGVAMYPDHGMNETQLMKYANIAVCDAKERGRNTVYMFNPEFVGSTLTDDKEADRD